LEQGGRGARDRLGKELHIEAGWERRNRSRIGEDPGAVRGREARSRVVEELGAGWQRS
jgi:hypothetical protein